VVKFVSKVSRWVVSALSSRGLTVGYQLEGFPPEDDALLHVQADAFQEKCVLQSTLVLEMAVLPQFAV
jgi:hypothetical protein